MKNLIVPTQNQVARIKKAVQVMNKTHARKRSVTIAILSIRSKKWKRKLIYLKLINYTLILLCYIALNLLTHITYD